MAKPLYIWGAILVAAAALSSTGCEGWDRKHDNKLVDVSPPPPDAEPPRMGHREKVNIPDMVENMHSARQAYINSIAELEKTFLVAGDSNRADWARRQRQLTEKVEVFPYLTGAAPEQRVDVAPVEQIPEADAVYNQALAIYKDVAAIPLAGALPNVKNKAREALSLFKQILNQYPRSDKVDDAAFYCGEIYKEYLREDDPDDELAIRYYKWAIALNPKTPHPARFQCAAVYDFRRHNRDAAMELYHQVLDLEENGNQSNMRFSASRIEQLSDEHFSHLKPQHPVNRRPEPDPKPDKSGVQDDGPVSLKTSKRPDRPSEPDTAP